MSRLPLRIVGACAALVVAGGVGWMTAQATLSSSPDVEEKPAQYVVSTVSEQTVGKTLNYSATAQLPTTPIFYNVLAGTLTSLSEPGGSLRKVRPCTR